MLTHILSFPQKGQQKYVTKYQRKLVPKDSMNKLLILLLNAMFVSVSLDHQDFEIRFHNCDTENKLPHVLQESDYQQDQFL